MNARTVYLVAPAFEEPWTGGTLYNARLFDALARAGSAAVRLDVSAVLTGKGPAEARELWVDSLYLGSVPKIAGAYPRSAVRLLMHYLPSLVREDRAGDTADLSGQEREAFASSSSFVTTSVWLAGVLTGAGVDAARIGVVAPGVTAPIRVVRRSVRPKPEGLPLRALMVANLLPGKGVLAFLEAWGKLRHPPRIALTIVGTPKLDPNYAARCAAAARAPSPTEIRFAGALSPDALSALMTTSDVLVSASRMESFGMALADARSVGLPILARRGGNVAAHVEEAAGGSLFDDDDGLVSALARLSGSPEELLERRRSALLSVRRRSWDDAAAEFLDVMNSHDSFRGAASV